MIYIITSILIGISSLHFLCKKDLNKIEPVMNTLWNDNQGLREALSDYDQQDFRSEEEIWVVSLVNCLISDEQANKSPLPSQCTLSSGEMVKGNFQERFNQILTTVKDGYIEKSHFFSGKGINFSKHKRKMNHNLLDLITNIEAEVFDLLQKRVLISTYLSNSHDMTSLFNNLAMMSPQNIKSSFIDEQTCPICFCPIEKDEDREYFHSCLVVKKHGIHSECFRGYISNYHNAGEGMPTCPHENCQDEVNVENMLSGANKLELDNNKFIFKKLLISQLEAQTGLSHCPDETCPGFTTQSHEGHKVCKLCLRIPCARCDHYHPQNMPCIETNGNGNRKRNPFRRLNIKYCPQCRAPTERISGCNHITCPCGYHWHFETQEQWQGYGQGQEYTWGHGLRFRR